LDANNGINDWTAAQPAYAINGGNRITVGLDTQTAFYQPSPSYMGQNIQVFRSENLNADNAHFIVPLLGRVLKLLFDLNTLKKAPKNGCFLLE
jgi:hypothetical protein